jgi:hypothetical protein
MTNPFVPMPDMPDPVMRCWPSRSQRAMPHQLKRLAQEVEVRWLDPAATGLPWLRELFTDRRPRGPGVRAITMDRRGRCVRAFLALERDFEAYARLRAAGCGTCPLEGVLPASIAPGQPAQPAHPRLRRGDLAMTPATRADVLERLQDLHNRLDQLISLQSSCALAQRHQPQQRRLWPWPRRPMAGSMRSVR